MVGRCQTAFQSCRTILHSLQKYVSIRLLHDFTNTWLVSVFFILKWCLVGFYWYLTEVLVSVSLMTIDVEFFLYLLIICLSSIKKYPTKTFIYLFLKTGFALARVAHLVGPCPANQRSWFNSWSGHVLGLWVWSSVGVHTRGNQLMFLTSMFLLIFLPPVPSLWNQLKKH